MPNSISRVLVYFIDLLLFFFLKFVFLVLEINQLNRGFYVF